MKRLWSRALDEVAHALRVSPDGRTLAVSTHDGHVRLFEVETGEVVFDQRLHERGALVSAYAADGCTLASGGHDGRVHLLDVASASVVGSLDVAAGRSPDDASAWVSALHFAGSETTEGGEFGGGDELLAVAVGRRARFFTREGSPLGEPTVHPSTVAALAHHPSLGWLSGSYGGVAFLEPGAPKERRRLGYRGSILALAISPEGTRIASGNQDSTVRFWDLESGEDASLTGYAGKVRAVCFSADGALLATVASRHVVLWACAGGSPLGTRPLSLSGHDARVAALAFDFGGTRLLTGGDDGRVVCHRLEESLPIEPIDVAGGSPVRALVADPTGPRVAVSRSDGAVELWELDVDL